MANSSPAMGPIFILGISQRSGTNFLFDLLRLHPDCGVPSIKWEDFLLHRANLLVEYVESTYQGWRRRGTSQEVEDLLYEQLGNGLLSVLASRIKAKRLVTKTPSVRNLNYFFKFFPRAYLLILVRDGRAVAESRVKMFQENHETAMKKWADGAGTILEFVQTADRFKSNYLIVRYEDLWNGTDKELRRIFAFIGLDADQYDFNAAINMPVRGSSFFNKRGVRWKPIDKTPDFNPVSRADDWTRSMHERFNWIAGDKLAKFGYLEKRYSENETFWILLNRILDLWWRLRGLFESTMSGVKSVLKWLFGADRMSRCRHYVIESSKAVFNLRRAISHKANY